MRKTILSEGGVRSPVLGRGITAAVLLLIGFGVAAQGCGMEDSAEFFGGEGYDGERGAPGWDEDADGWYCTTDGDCPPGMVCQGNQCVSPDDGKPPEEPEGHVFMEPDASPGFIYALSPHTDTLAIIDALDLAIEIVPLPPEPTDLSVLPDRDAVAVVSREGKSLTLLDEEDGVWRGYDVRLERRFEAVSVCPGGRWAVLWTPDGAPPGDGAEGMVALVDLAAMEAGDSVSVLEMAAGRRHTNVYFREDGGRTADIVVVGKEEIAIIDTSHLDEPVPARIFIPDEYIDVYGRQVVVSEGGEHALLRSFVAPEILVFHTATRTMTSVPLPAVATDLKLVRAPGHLVAPRTRAVVALRSAGMLGWFYLDEALVAPEEPGLVETIEMEDVVTGQVSVSEDGRFAVVFTNAEPSTTIAWIDFDLDEVRVFERLQKWVRAVGIGPDGRTALVLHRPDPGSTTADPYERAIEKDEGYSLVDLEQGYAQLKLTDGVPAEQFVFSVDGEHAAVVLSDDQIDHRVDTIDLGRLVTHTFSLASRPRFAGALPSGPAVGGDRVWITQAHPAGRVSFLNLGERTLRTVTGFDLNAEVE